MKSCGVKQSLEIVTVCLKLTFPRSMRILALICLSLISCQTKSQDQWKNIYTESAWAERDKWQRADAIIEKLGVKAGDKVADVGSHEGYMTVKLAKAVGKAGRVYAVDISQSKLDQLQEHLKDRSIDNVSTIKGDYDNPKLPINSLQGALIIDTYHEMDSYDKILQHIRAALVEGGKLIICEAIANERRKLARAEQERKHEIGIDHVLADLSKAGFMITFKRDPYIDRQQIKGDNMWIIVAQKQR